MLRRAGKIVVDALQMRTCRAHTCSAVVASFGGLLMMLQAEQKHLIRIALDSKVYALIKVVAAK